MEAAEYYGSDGGLKEWLQADGGVGIGHSTRRRNWAFLIRFPGTEAPVDSTVGTSR